MVIRLGHYVGRLVLLSARGLDVCSPNECTPITSI